VPVERLPAVGVPLDDGLVEGRLGALPVPDQLADPQALPHDFDRRDATAAPARQQALGDHEAQHLGQPVADQPLLPRAEQANEAPDRQPGVDGVQRRQHEVAGFRSLQPDLDRLGVAQLADHDDFGRLAQRGAQPGREAREVGAQLALVDRCPPLRVCELHRVFEGHDVHAAHRVDRPDDGGERRGLAAAGGAGDQHQPVVQRGRPRGSGQARSANVGMPESTRTQSSRAARPGRR
jgi:hypothetical protein